jgi:hypothetical protein
MGFSHKKELPCYTSDGILLLMDDIRVWLGCENEDVRGLRCKLLYLMNKQTKHP